MKRAPLTYRGLAATPEARAQFREIERGFHERAFGEELARVNLDMPLEARRRYLDWMRDNARKHGVEPEVRFPYTVDGLTP